MEESVKNVLRVVAMVMLVFLIMAVPVAYLLAGPVLGFMAYKLVSGSDYTSDPAVRRTQREQRRTERRQAATLGKERRATRREFYSAFRGWKPEALPPGFVANPDRSHGGTMSIDACGIKGLIEAKRDRLFTREKGDVDKILFSFPLRDADHALQMRAYMEENGVGAKLSRGRNGVWRVATRNAWDASRLAREAWPEDKKKFDREITFTNQYLVDGCSSYEQAVEKLKELKQQGISPVATQVSELSSVEGGPSRTETSGRLLDKNTLVSMPSGAYLVQESSVQADSALVRVPADVSGEKDLLEFCRNRMDEGMVEKRMTMYSQKDVVDATPEGVERITDQNGISFMTKLGPAEYDAVTSLSKQDLHAWVVIENPGQMRAIAQQGRIPGGATVSVGRNIPESQSGKIVLEVPLDSPQLITGVGLSGMEGRMDGYREMDDRVLSGESVTCRVRGGLGLDRARVDGMPAVEMLQHAANPRSSIAGMDQLWKWSQEAARIESVTYTLDLNRGEMRLNQTVGGVTKTEVIPLSEKDARALKARGDISKSELKDLVMQTHPDFFQTYRGRRGDDGRSRSVFSDPVRAFIEGRKPEKAGLVSAVQGRRNNLTAKAGLGGQRKPSSKAQRPAPAQKGGIKF